jgi:tRNA(His) guanylyltransferase
LHHLHRKNTDGLYVAEYKENKMSDKKDTFGDRIKEFESAAAKVMLDEDQPLCVRIDGKAFHTYTHGLARPYDERLSNAMVETMNFLVEKTDARVGYTQSDEISLVYFKTAPHQQSYFGSRVQKLVSVLASMATAKFNDVVHKTIPEKAEGFAFFDCRVWNVPTLQDAADVFLWRHDDARKNAISMAAYAYYSHKQLMHKNSGEKIAMLKDKEIDFDAYPDFFKTGTYAMRAHQRVQMDEQMKTLPGNKGKDSYLRSYVKNFYLPRLRGTEYMDVLFAPVFEEHALAVQERNSRKGK